MTNVTTIPAGYRLTITSWENDADNYKTVIIEGLTNERASYLADLCKLLSDDNPRNNQSSEGYKGRDKRYNNMYEPGRKEIDMLMEELDKIVLKHGQHLSEDVVPGHDAAEYGYEELYELGLSGGDFFTRCCSEWKIEHIPNDVIMLDVTDNFK